MCLPYKSEYMKNFKLFQNIPENSKKSQITHEFPRISQIPVISQQKPRIPILGF